jgi:predicted LPLAT superfamily acyltransferase
MRFTVWCYRSLGRRLSLGIVYLVLGYFFLTDGPGRRASRAYLRRVWATPAGKAALGSPPGPWQSFQHYRAFALSIIDRLAIWFGRDGEFEYTVHGYEVCDRFQAEGRGYLILGAHLGSFDALRLLADRQQRPVNVLMYTEHAQRTNRIFRELSPAAEARVIPVDPGSVDAVFEIRERVARGEIISILGDRVEPSDRGRTSRVPFLGGSVELPQAPFLLAHLLGCPIVLMVPLAAGPGRYEVFAELLAERVCLPRGDREKRLEELLTAYAQRLERYCTRAPLQWFNFFDYWGDDVATVHRSSPRSSRFRRRR